MGDVIVTTGAAFCVCWFHVTVLSVLVDAAFGLPAASFALLGAIVTVTVPEVVIPLTAMSNVLLSPESVTLALLPAVPVIVTSPFWNPDTASLKTAVKWIGELLVGSAWPTAWSIVTVGAAASIVRWRTEL